MTATIIQIELKLGDAKRLNPVIIETKEGRRVNLEGFEVLWNVYRTNGIRPILTKTSKNAPEERGVVILNMEHGVLCIYINSQDTRSLGPGRYYHDIQIVDSQGQTTTVASGVLIISNKLW